MTGTDERYPRLAGGTVGRPIPKARGGSQPWSRHKRGTNRCRAGPRPSLPRPTRPGRQGGRSHGRLPRHRRDHRAPAGRQRRPRGGQRPRPGRPRGRGRRDRSQGRPGDRGAGRCHRPRGDPADAAAGGAPARPDRGAGRLRRRGGEPVPTHQLPGTSDGRWWIPWTSQARRVTSRRGVSTSTASGLRCWVGRPMSRAGTGPSTSRRPSARPPARSSTSVSCSAGRRSPRWTMGPST
jgi:hypothetical protein